MTKSLALELAEHSIRVNSTHQGLIATAIAEALVSEENALDIPLRRAALRVPTRSRRWSFSSPVTSPPTRLALSSSWTAV